MRIILIILACAIAYFAAAIGIDYITGDETTAKSLVKNAISALVFSAIFVPIILKASKRKL